MNVPGWLWFVLLIIAILVLFLLLGHPIHIG